MLWAGGYVANRTLDGFQHNHVTYHMYSVRRSTSVATAIEQAPKPLRWSVALVTACDLFFCAASYLSVLFSALLLYASLLVWMTAGVPWIVYATQVNERLRKSFLTRYLNNEIEKFFVEVRRTIWVRMDRVGRGEVVITTQRYVHA